MLFSALVRKLSFPLVDVDEIGRGKGGKEIYSAFIL